MRKGEFKIAVLVLTVFVLMAGCATTKPKAADTNTDLMDQTAKLQAELAAKDQQIQELQYQLDTYKSALQNTSSGGHFSSKNKSSKSSMIRVPGVSVQDVQKALVNAGFDPGPVDGQWGKKTKAAIKEFQRKNRLTPDGIVGERTWSYLRA
jgi:conjugal transfer/entry exclusion protein